jgi:hypothetical protein
MFRQNSGIPPLADRVVAGYDRDRSGLRCHGYLDKELAAITADEFFQVVENHARDGVDFMTNLRPEPQTRARFARIRG